MRQLFIKASPNDEPVKAAIYTSLGSSDASVLDFGVPLFT